MLECSLIFLYSSSYSLRYCATLSNIYIYIYIERERETFLLVERHGQIRLSYRLVACTVEAYPYIVYWAMVNTNDHGFLI